MSSTDPMLLEDRPQEEDADDAVENSREENEEGLESAMADLYTEMLRRGMPRAGNEGLRNLQMKQWYESLSATDRYNIYEGVSDSGRKALLSQFMSVKTLKDVLELIENPEKINFFLYYIRDMGLKIELFKGLSASQQDGFFAKRAATSKSLTLSSMLLAVSEKRRKELMQILASTSVDLTTEQRVYRAMYLRKAIGYDAADVVDAKTTPRKRSIASIRSKIDRYTDMCEALVKLISDDHLDITNKVETQTNDADLDTLMRHVQAYYPGSVAAEKAGNIKRLATSMQRIANEVIRKAYYNYSLWAYDIIRTYRRETKRTRASDAAETTPGNLLTESEIDAVKLDIDDIIEKFINKGARQFENILELSAEYKKTKIEFRNLSEQFLQVVKNTKKEEEEETTAPTRSQQEMVIYQNAVNSVRNEIVRSISEAAPVYDPRGDLLAYLAMSGVQTARGVISIADQLARQNDLAAQQNALTAQQMQIENEAGKARLEAEKEKSRLASEAEKARRTKALDTWKTEATNALNSLVEFDAVLKEAIENKVRTQAAVTALSDLRLNLRSIIEKSGDVNSFDDVDKQTQKALKKYTALKDMIDNIRIAVDKAKRAAEEAERLKEEKRTAAEAAKAEAARIKEAEKAEAARIAEAAKEEEKRMKEDAKRADEAAKNAKKQKDEEEKIRVAAEKERQRLEKAAKAAAAAELKMMRDSSKNKEASSSSVVVTSLGARGRSVRDVPYVPIVRGEDVRFNDAADATAVFPNSFSSNSSFTVPPPPPPVYSFSSIDDSVFPSTLSNSYAPPPPVSSSSSYNGGGGGPVYPSSFSSSSVAPPPPPSVSYNGGGGPVYPSSFSSSFAPPPPAPSEFKMMGGGPDGNGDDDPDADPSAGLQPTNLVPQNIELTPHMRFISLAMGVNGFRLIDAFVSDDEAMIMNTLNDVDSRVWTDYEPYLKMELLTAASVLLSTARAHKHGVSMDDIAVKCTETGGTALGRILASIAVTNRLRNPTRNNVITANWRTCIEIREFTSRVSNLRIPHSRDTAASSNNNKQRMSESEKYIEFVRVAAGMAGRSYAEIIPNFDASIVKPKWTELRKILSPELDAAMVHAMRLIRRLLPETTTEDTIITNDALRVPCARLVGRYVVQFESDNAASGTNRIMNFVQTRALKSAVLDVRNACLRA